MIQERITILALCITVLFGAEAAIAQQGGPRVTFSKTTVTADGVEKGGSVIFFSMGLDSDGYGGIVRKNVAVRDDDDRDRQVVLTVEPAVAWRSVWVVIDVTNGQFTVASPEGYRIRPSEFRRELKRGSKSNALDEFSTDIGSLDALYFQPGKGAWVGHVDDGDAADGDLKQDGKTTLRLGEMTPLLTLADRPREFGPGGILVAIDIFSMQVFASKVDGLLGGR
jgi:hypothetical protein